MRIASSFARPGLALAIASLTFASACKKDVIIDQAGGEIALTWSPAGVANVLNVPGTAITGEINKQMAGDAPKQLSKDTWEHAQRLYKNYQGVPLWLTGDGLDKPRAGALMFALADGTSDGLRLDAYPLEALGAAIDTLNLSKTPTAEQLASVDVLLTAAYVALGEDLMTGQVSPKSAAQSWHIDATEEKVDSALFRSLRAAELERAIAMMRPLDEGYDSLRVQLTKYRALAAKGWTTVPAGKVLKAGQTDSPTRIAALTARLAEEGYAVETAPEPAAQTPPATPSDSGAVAAPAIARPAPTVFTKSLADAVAAFQSRHGMTVTGTLTSETVASMNVSPQYRAGQIAANLERFRWMPRALGQRYIMVNVPAFKVAAYDSGRQVLEMKVIVGSDYEGRATPVFADTMQTVVFRPYWNVTPTIQADEFMPKIAADPGYMERGNYEFYKDGGTTRIRQRPGDKNALGLVKFLFPNDFNIYLHDTPQDNLFEKDVRGFSHGCIRLEKPDEMAQFVLGWDMERIHAAMNGGGDNKTIVLKKAIPVYIVYFTSYVTDGQLFFGNDLYKRDGTLVDDMIPGAIPPSDHERAIRTLHKIAEQWGGRDMNH